MRRARLENQTNIEANICFYQKLQGKKLFYQSNQQNSLHYQN